jgi:hypothetical protein
MRGSRAKLDFRHGMRPVVEPTAFDQTLGLDNKEIGLPTYGI